MLWEKGKTMVELINKWDVVNKLIQLENNYQFYKEQWDADVLYRRICELEIGIGKTPGLEVVRCKDCKHYKQSGCQMSMRDFNLEDDFCSYGERKDNG
jgi:hypothetical protein